MTKNGLVPIIQTGSKGWWAVSTLQHVVSSHSENVLGFSRYIESRR